jgi:hypothetical protein
MTPVKPFATYKWRWLSVQPTESLLLAPIFLGVLRALSRHEGEAFSSDELRADLGQVADDTNSPVDLVRTPERNLFRNSGQYWRGTGLLVPQPGIVQLTGLGRRVAAGAVTQAEFASLMIQQTVLPNPVTYTLAELAHWNAANLQIRPLKLILEVLEALGRLGGLSNASLNNDELVRVLIPLAGVVASPVQIADHIMRYRLGTLSVAGWPDCAPAANDWRLAREFLLFLANFGVLRLDAVGVRDEQRFYLPELFDVDAAIAPVDASLFEGDEDADEAVLEIQHSDLPSIVARQKVVTQVLSRTGQAAFRNLVMGAYNSRCIVTGETIPNILEAAHIVPVSEHGADHENNSFCMRVDIHRLYDSGNLRIMPGGAIVKSEVMQTSPNYGFLPTAIEVPAFVNPANLTWRTNYL